MKMVLVIIAAIIILFDIIMVTPIGLFWFSKNYDEGKPAYGFIIMFVSAIPLMIILGILGLV